MSRPPRPRERGGRGMREDGDSVNRTVRDLEDKFEEAVGLLGPTGRRMLALLAVRLGGEQGDPRPAIAVFGLRGEPAFSLEVEFPADVLRRVAVSDLADVLAEQILGDVPRFAESRAWRDAEALLGVQGGAAAGARLMEVRSLNEVLALGADAPPLSEASVSVSDRAPAGEGLLEYLWHSGSIVRGRARLAKRGTVGGDAHDA